MAGQKGFSVQYVKNIDQFIRSNRNLTLLSTYQIQAGRAQKIIKNDLFIANSYFIIIFILRN